MPNQMWQQQPQQQQQPINGGDTNNNNKKFNNNNRDAQPIIPMGAAPNGNPNPTHAGLDR